MTPRHRHHRAPHHPAGPDAAGPHTAGGRRARAHQPDRILAHWNCPVCLAAVPRLAQPGRPRVYCTNACRQRAYRWRRDARTRPRLRPLASYVRGRTRERSHAMQPSHDLTSGATDSIGKEITLCGTFARRARHQPGGHTQFVPQIPWSCRTCARLLDPSAQPPQFSDLVSTILATIA